MHRLSTQSLASCFRAFCCTRRFYRPRRSHTRFRVLCCTSRYRVLSANIVLHSSMVIRGIHGHRLVTVKNPRGRSRANVRVISEISINYPGRNACSSRRYPPTAIVWYQCIFISWKNAVWELDENLIELHSSVEALYRLHDVQTVFFPRHRY